MHLGHGCSGDFLVCSEWKCGHETWKPESTKTSAALSFFCPKHHNNQGQGYSLKSNILWPTTSY